MFGSSHHSVQFYSEDSFLLDEVARFAGSSLGAGGSCLVVATESHCTGIRQRLAALGLELDSITASSRYIERDCDATLALFVKDGAIDPIAFRQVIGPIIDRAGEAPRSLTPQVAVFGEMVASLVRRGLTEAAIELEQCWNELGQEKAFALHCAYPMNLFPRADDGEALARICHAHSHVMPAESYMSLGSEDSKLRETLVLQQKAVALETELGERARLLAAEQEARALAEEALRARDQFLSVAAHELRTPMTVLKGSVEVLMRRQTMDQLDPQELSRLLSLAHDSVERLSRLTHDLLDASETSTALLSGQRERVGVAGLIARSVDEARSVHGGDASFTVTGHLDDVDVWGIPERLSEVFTCLIENAVKYSESGDEVVIQVDTLQDDIVVTVRDQGIGVPIDFIERVFEPFLRAPNAISNHVPGMGLGLHICRTIIDAHGGRIWVESPGEGEGTSVSISVPASPTSD